MNCANRWRKDKILLALILVLTCANNNDIIITSRGQANDQKGGLGNGG